MNKKEILDYVMNTPGNTNYSVLKSLLENEQDKLIPGSGIEISEANEIRSDLFDLNDSTLLNNALRPFTSRTMKRNLGAGPFASYITYLLEKLTIAAKGSEFKNALSGYKNLAVSFSTGIAAPTLTNLLTNGDFYEFERAYFHVPDNLVTILQRYESKIGTPKISDTINAVTLSTRFLISGIEGVLSKMNDDDTYTFEWSFRYWTYVNGDRILDINGAYAGLIDPANFSLGNVAFFGLK